MAGDAIGPAGSLLDPQGLLRPLPAAAFDAIPWNDLRLWCHFNARYGLPTTELVAWLREVIAGRPAIEIGAGAGDLAHHLGIPGTDSHLQDWPEIARYYQALQQPTIRYGRDVEKLDAEAAIRKHRPRVVLASWVTEWIDPALPPPPNGGNMHGIKEDAIVAAGLCYILVGNEAVHGRKRIMALPHKTHALPFLRSRGHDRAGNRVYVWNP